MRQTTAPRPIDIARQHTEGDRRAADEARRLSIDDAPDAIEVAPGGRIRRFVRTLVGPIHGGSPGATRTA